MEEHNDKPRILFLCTGNVCRSQMAEAWARHLKSDRLDVYSAGLHPAGVVSSRTMKVMEEAGVDMSGQFSKGLDYWADLDFDYVVVLCERAFAECPPFPETTRVISHTVPDPTLIIGPLDQVKGVFQEVSDMIRTLVESLPESLREEYPQGNTQGRL